MDDAANASTERGDYNGCGPQSNVRLPAAVAIRGSPL